MASVDPFRAVQEDARAQFADVTAEIGRWQKLPPKSSKAEETRQSLLAALSDLQVDLQDMQATIDIALRDPAKFALTPSELMARQSFVRDLQAEANDARDLLQAGGRARSDRQNLLSAASDGDGGGSSSRAESRAESRARAQAAARADNQNALAGQQQQQEQIIEEQEQELTVLSSSLGRLDEMGRTINTELKRQGHDLEEFAQEVEGTRSMMAEATSRMNKMLKRKDKGRLCTIVVLTFVLILLCYLVFT